FGFLEHDLFEMFAEQAQLVRWINVQKSFVYRVKLNDILAKIFDQNIVDLIREFPIKRVVARYHGGIVELKQFAYVKKRRRHFYTECFYFIAARYYAAVIVR